MYRCPAFRELSPEVARRFVEGWRAHDYAPVLLFRTVTVRELFKDARRSLKARRGQTPQLLTGTDGEGDMRLRDRAKPD